MEVTERMNEQEMKKVAMEKYTSIQRIKKYGEKEIKYQEKILKAELAMLGIPAEDLELREEE